VGRLYLRLAPPPIAVIDIIFGAFLSQAISASAQLGIADELAAGPLTKEELAGRIGADPDSVARLMRLLISRGVFRRRRDGRFALNALADTLRTDSPVSTRGAALLFGSPQHRANWTRLADAVRTGEPNPPKVFGKDFFDYLRDDPEFAEIFNSAMTSTSSVLEAAVVAATTSPNSVSSPTSVAATAGYSRRFSPPPPMPAACCSTSPRRSRGRHRC
jgi:hypothetical protein